MSERDPLADLAEQLFAAARDEQPSPELCDRVLRAAREPSTITQARPIQLASRRAAWSAAAAALALAAAWLLFTVSSPAGPRPRFSISPERVERRPAHEIPDVTAPEANDDVQTHGSPAATRLANERGPLRAKAQRAPVVATLAAEVAALERARKALAEADASAALRALDDYDHVLQGTQLRAEAALLRIEALAKHGEGARAAELARSFEERFPGSPLADRARSFAKPPDTNDHVSPADPGGTR
ncbi:MAG TPA: hypothetical protein VHM19_17265 [Polyangiales bacterium]|jgi:hypothetical protein|nr:hypothetical protein [Polyangiales bacterium]